MTIAVSCGEPAGIGPEIAATAWEMLRGDLPFLWIGAPEHLPDGTPFTLIDDPRDAAGVAPVALPVLILPEIAAAFTAPLTHGVANPAHARGVIGSIEAAVRLVQDGACSAICTAPLHKKALIDGAGFAYPGHTEFLAALAGVERVVMMLASPLLKVVPVTIHIPLMDVPQALTAELLAASLRITHAGLQRDFGLTSPRIAIAGLNPHAGEGGKMGHEEERMIIPVLDAMRAEGMDVSGPYSADTLFHEAARARYDVAVCMYHDQALIPIKTLDFAGGVNVTLGLPFVRTSPDHGTAFDIAGKGLADPTSMIAALKMADAMARRRASA